jgi:hypothetical protein
MEVQTPDVAVGAPIESGKVEGHRFYVTMAALALLTVFLGFAPRFLLPADAGRPLRPFVLLHVVVFSGWMVLFFVQTSLVSAQRTDLHRRLGLVGVALIGTMIALGIVTGVEGARNGWNPGGPFRDSLAFLVVPFRDIGRAHRIDVIGALIVLATFPLGIVISRSDAWHNFAAWLIR